VRGAAGAEKSRRWSRRNEEGSTLARKRKPRERREKDEAWQKKQKRKVCVFCRDRVTYVDYKDTTLLRRFVSDRGKIRARRVTGTCAQHQRDVATAVKNAREMALLPYSTR
jgi:small subunit ribosomal protein S18